DHVLRDLAARLKGVIRTDELLARYGGEEFVVVLPEATRENARGVAERLRLLVEQDPFTFDGHSIAVTISIGIASLDDGEAIVAADLVERADRCLYDAKVGGRNRVAG